MAADLAASRGDDPQRTTAGSRPRPEHVGIVGAGVAGLRCADVLLKHGIRVTILEGRTRVGGRVRLALSPALTAARLTTAQLAQADLDGHTVDLYAQPAAPVSP